ncbi:hypothetical protein OBBRIDRAFT_281591 [Obba rivulosa]|uniref:Fungal-type protein kinase domain-containing protein n=1 Tax=Obba rivulosa TaxID=1052685 RepID=A0A8E2DHG9_9APHY|nr:hypothetical protein OBBRIDRAFT_281591 [Obba rivulosa]
MVCEQIRDLMEETKGHCVGPMPTETFLDTFLGGAQLKGMPSSRTVFKNLKETFTEDVMSRALASALNGKYRSRCPGFKIVPAALPTGHEDETRPGMICYADEVADKMKGANDTYETDFARTEFFMDIQQNEDGDFFQDPPVGTSRRHAAFIRSVEDDERQEALYRSLARNIAFADQTFLEQYRVGYFSISVCGLSARLLRWDRAGVVVTEAFNLKKQPGVLCEFLWRFAHASNPERGYDCTVQDIYPFEEKLFRDAIKRHVKLQLFISHDKPVERAVLKHYKPGALVALMVVDADESKPGMCRVHRWIVSKTVITPPSLWSRGTTGYWAVNNEGTVGFLKDTWRFISRTMSKEGDVLKELHSAGVRNIPEVLHYGDLPEAIHSCDTNGFQSIRKPSAYQTTMSHAFRDAEWVCRRGINSYAQVHHRMVSKTVGYALKKFTGSVELFKGIFGALIAILDTFQKAGRIHRDISLNNIILVRDSEHEMVRGYLIDWESAIAVDAEGRAPSDHRVGTKAFMSARILAKQRKPTIQDEMESLFYVALYSALNWLRLAPSSIDRRKVFNYLFYDEALDGFGKIDSGSGKAESECGAKFLERMPFKTEAVNDWFLTIALKHVVPFGSSHACELCTSEVDRLRHFAEEMDVYMDEALLSFSDRSDERVTKDEKVVVNLTAPVLPAARPSKKRKADSEEIGAQQEAEQSLRIKIPPLKRSRIDDVPPLGFDNIPTELVVSQHSNEARDVPMAEATAEGSNQQRSRLKMKLRPRKPAQRNR